MQQRPDQLVVLGVKSDDALDIFIQGDGDDALHQAARIVSHNGVAPAALAAVMNDLSHTFGWSQIVGLSAPEVPQPPLAVTRAGEAAAAALPTGHGKPGSFVEFRSSIYRGRVLEYLKAGPSTSPEMRAHFGIPVSTQATFDRMLRRMRQDGEVTRVKTGNGRGKAAIWRLADKA